MIGWLVMPLRTVRRLWLYFQNGYDPEHEDDHKTMERFDKQLRELNGWREDGRGKGSL